jgi:hypothetical protein
MNVKEIRQRIFDQMDYFPDLQQYRDSVVRRINDRYQELCDSAHWLWIQKETAVNLKAEIKGSSTNTISHSAGNPRRLTTSFECSTQMESQTLTNSDTGTSFTIIRAYDNRTLYISDDFVNTGAATTDSQDFKITFDKVALPKDCVEVLGFIDRKADRGRLLFVNRRREEHAYLDKDTTGDPSVIIEDEHIVDDPPIRTPQAAFVEAEVRENGVAGAFNIGTSHTVAVNAGTSGSANTRANQLSLTSRLQNMLGVYFSSFIFGQVSAQQLNQLLPSTTYEYMYTIYREGRESPPSETVTVETTSSPGAIFLFGFENTGYYQTSIATTKIDNGMYKHVYRRDVTNDQKWMLVGTIPSDQEFFSDFELIPKAPFHYLMSGVAGYRYTSTTDIIRFKDPGPYQYVRFWYAPDEDKSINIRYHYRPEHLVADNDAPIIPYQYHQILVYMVLQDMFLQMQDTVQSQLFERRAQTMLAQLRRRYLAREDDKKRFGRWDRGGGRSKGVPSLVHHYDNVIL